MNFGGVVLASAGVAVLTSQPSLAQSVTAATPRFEVASIKPTSREGADVQGRGDIRMMPGGRFIVERAQLRYIIQSAYDVKPFQLLGGPAWINSAHFDVEAKAEGNPSPAVMRPMMQTLLEERFQLKVHHETRELPVYDLVAGKGGIKLSEPKAGSCVTPDPNAGSMPPAPGEALPCGRILIAMSPSGAQMRGGAVTMKELIRVLSNVLGRIVLDKTGLLGTFDVHMEFTVDETLGGRPVPPRAAAGDVDVHGNIFAAVQDQLGLKLEAAKGPVDVVVIDSVGRLREN